MSAQKAPAGKKKPEDRTSGLPYEVDMTSSAEEVYKKLARQSKAAEAAGDYVSAHCTTFQMVRDAITRIIPNDPLNKCYALRGDLANIFRIRKGRMRICWIASSQMRRVCILFISESLRKEGDAHDPYVIFKSLLESGMFDAMIQKYGVRIPKKGNSKHLAWPN
ncbi:MAG: type II toxin-antitoxin system RelE family toxin [Acidobacteriota bacterium]